ncbi:MAG TPA: PPE family protein [Mycobacterium sp.]|nr:PPE family protein [Mycobacterium sp.]
MDFGAIPPEMNSARMYSGAGPGPMLAAAESWGALAAELYSAASSYSAVISDLAGGDWHGPSAAAMAAAAAPYVEWMSRTAGQAEQSAAQVRAAAAAYEAAFAATVPPPVIAANRSQLATLIATNLLGQNTLAIAATEAHYAAMWAQDAAAMYSYAGASSAATKLTSFAEPPQTTRAGAVAAQSAARQAGSNATAHVSRLMSLMPNTLQNMATAATAEPLSLASITAGYSSLTEMFNNLAGAYSPLGLAAIPGTWWLTALQALGLAQNGPGIAALLGGTPPITGVLGPLSGGYISYETPVGPPRFGPGAVTVSMGRAASVGALSVPTGWSSAAPEARTAAALMPAGAGDFVPAMTAESQSSLLSELGLSTLAGRAMGGSAARSVAGATVRVIDKEADLELDNLTTATILVIPAAEELGK